MTIQLKAYITASGEIKAELPKNHPVGAVTLIIEPETTAAMSWELQAWTADELNEMLAFHPRTLGDIQDYLQANAGSELDYITDSEAWVAETRRKEEQRRNTWTPS
jgi:hypothetical protein